MILTNKMYEDCSTVQLLWFVGSNILNNNAPHLTLGSLEPLSATA